MESPGAPSPDWCCVANDLPAQFAPAVNLPCAEKPSIAKMPDVSTIKRPAGTATPAEVAEQRLRQSPYFYLKSLRCRFDSGVLTLQGRVPYRPLRQVAEAIVARVDGVQRVANEVEVIDPGYSLPNVAPAVRTAG